MADNSDFEFREITCPVCGSDDRVIVGWRGGDAHQSGAGFRTAIARCRECSHQYPNPMPFLAKSLEELYVDADAYFKGHDLETKKQNGLRLMREFENRVGHQGIFLDVGCGTGELVWAAKQSGWEATGVDPSREFVEIGRTKLSVEALVSTLEEAGFAESSFDAIAMSSIIEHLYDPFSTLREVWRVLKPGGILWFDAPNEDGLYMKIGNLYMKLLGRDWVVVMAPTFPPYHVQGFNPTSVRRIVKRSGFELQDIEISGGVCEQQGQASLRKSLEYLAARLVNQVGKIVHKGSYMSVWAQKL